MALSLDVWLVYLFINYASNFISMPNKLPTIYLHHLYTFKLHGTYATVVG